jgi:hypothetical protein
MQKLIKEDGTELQRVTTTHNIQGFPDDSIEDGDSDDRKFDIDQEF